MSTDLIAPPPAAGAPASRSLRRPFALVVAAASLPMFMATLDNLVMTNALPVLHRQLGATVEQLQWFVNAYTLAFASAILLASALGDRFGRRRIFTIGIAVFGVGSVLAALSTDPTGLILARALQGFGAAGVLPLSLALIAGAVAPERRALAIGIWGGVSGLGVAVGPLVGGAIIQGWSWEAIFWINVPVAVVAIPLAYFALKNTFGDRERIDVIGLVTVALGVLGLVHGIVRGNGDGWTSVSVIAELAVGAALVAAFLFRQARSSAPVVPLRLFGDRSFSVTNLLTFAFSFGTFGSIFILIQFLQVVQGATPLGAAVQTMPWTLAPMVVAPIAGIIAPRVGTRLLMVVGLLLQGIALLWLALALSATVSYGALVAPFLLAGIGMALVFAPSATALLARLRERDHAKASGVNSTVREIGVALGTAVLTAIFTGAGGRLLPESYIQGARPAVFVGAMVLFLGTLIALRLPAGRGQSAVIEDGAELTTLTDGARPVVGPDAVAVPA